MPRKTRVAAASAKNGTMSGHGRLGGFYCGYCISFSYLIKKNPAQKPQHEATMTDGAPFKPPIVFEDKFRCAVPRGSLHLCSNLGQHSMLVQIRTQKTSGTSLRKITLSQSQNCLCSPKTNIQRTTRRSQTMERTQRFRVHAILYPKTPQHHFV